MPSRLDGFGTDKLSLPSNRRFCGFKNANNGIGDLGANAISWNQCHGMRFHWVKG